MDSKVITTANYDNNTFMYSNEHFQSTFQKVKFENKL